MTIARRYDPDHFELVENTLRLRAAAIPTTAYVDGQDAATLAAALAADVHLTSSAPADVTKAAAAAGSATTAAKADHKHDVSTGTPGTTTPGASAAEGSATSLARSDHAHALAPFGTTAGTFCQGNDARILAAITSPLAAALDANGQRVENLPFPAADADAARRIDRAWLQPVRVAQTTGALAACTYSSSGNGTLTANANGALTVDTVSPSVGDAVLVAAEATGANNGVYTVTQVGDASHPWILTRRADFAHGAAIPAGLGVVVTDGSAALKAQVFIGPQGTVGTTALTVSTPWLRTPLLGNVDGNSKNLSAINLVSSQVGSSSTRTTYDGATKVLSTDRSSNFSAAPTVARYTLTADTLTITIDESTWANGDTVEFWSTTETTAPAHTFACSSTGKFKFAGSGGGGSGASTAPWPSGATCVVITRYASGVYLRS